MPYPNVHKCPAPICEEVVEFELYGCRNHWWAMPPALRGPINRSWRTYVAHPTAANRARHAAAKQRGDEYLASRYPAPAVSG